MKILVTGAAGFIGFHLCSRLVESGHRVVGLDNINNYYDVDLKYARLSELGIAKAEISKDTCITSRRFDTFSFIKADIENQVVINSLFKEEQFDVVCHLAAQAGVRYSIENPHAYVSSNVVGFMNILDAVQRYGIKHLVYASSSSIYGNNTKIPFSEGDNVDRPISIYAATKKVNELMAHTYSHLYGIKTTGLRFFTVYGPWGRPDMAYYKFAQAISQGQAIDVYNHGQLRRDFTFIDDIIEGLVAVICQNGAQRQNYEVFNIGNNTPVALMDFIQCLETSLGLKAQCNYLPMQAGDVFETFADIDKLNQVYNYQPKTSIKQGLKAFAAWYKNYYKI